MAMDDIATGRLQKAGYKMLVTAELACLSDEQAQAVRKFVADGGVLFAMGRLGGYDLRGAPATGNNTLADLAGIDLRAATPSTNTVDATFAGDKVPVFLAYNGVTLKDATVLAATPVDGQPQPVFTHTQRGNGQVYWLNTSFSAQAKFIAQVKLTAAQVAQDKAIQDEVVKDMADNAAKAKSSSLASARFISAAAHGAGLQPKCRLLKDGQPFSDHPSETWYYQSPSARSWFIGRYVSTNATLAVEFQQPAHLYDLRGHNYLGQTATVTQEFKPGEMHVYALLDYKVAGLQATLSTATAKRGDNLRLACVVTTADGNQPDLHALRVQVTGPDGQRLPAYRKVLFAPDGKAQMDIPLAFDEPLGKHAVNILDVISGSTATATFTVTGPAAATDIPVLEMKP